MRFLQQEKKSLFLEKITVLDSLYEKHSVPAFTKAVEKSLK